MSEFERLATVLRGLMARYSARVPDVAKILSAMAANGLVAESQEVENDHIAFRTLGVPNLGIASLERIFLALGYSRRDRYHFEKKKLDAFWYAPPREDFPRIFISELRVDELSTTAKKLLHSYTDEVTEDPVLSIDLTSAKEIDKFLHEPRWRLPSWSDYKILLAESEYAAWTIYNRYYLNHFTISVHNLPEPYADLARFNEFLKGIGITLNDAGGEIKTSADGLLLQSSTVAQTVSAEFISQGEATVAKNIAGSYVEFAERKPLPQFAHLPPQQLKREHRREGFEASNADKIFESTFTSQVGRKA